MDELKEKEWRVIEEAPKYEVSNYGDVRNIKTQKLIRGSLDKDGYPRVMLTNPEGKRITRYRHRLVALAFIPNPENLPQINHKDEIKSNAYVENLEWCSCSYNINYGEGAKRRIETIRNNKKHTGPRPGFEVYVYAKDTKEFLGKYISMAAAAKETGGDYRTIHKCCNKVQGYKSHHGMIFSFGPLEN